MHSPCNYSPGAEPCDPGPGGRCRGWPDRGARARWAAAAARCVDGRPSRDATPGDGYRRTTSTVERRIHFPNVVYSPELSGRVRQAV
jgi:hypothetical protein